VDVRVARNERIGVDEDELVKNEDVDVDVEESRLDDDSAVVDVDVEDVVEKYDFILYNDLDDNDNNDDE